MERTLADNSVVMLVYDPGATPPELISAYADWLEGRFESCDHAAGASSLRVQYFVTRDIRCDLFSSEEPIAARYENGMKLANALLQFDGEQLDLHLLWERLKGSLHSVSLQIFDDSGARVASIDRTIPRHDGPAFHLQLDLSSLEKGDYMAKLIVYNYETRVDLPGVVASTGIAFDRALELNRLTID